VSRSLGALVAGAVVIATFSCVVGILVPMQFQIPVPTGGAIVLVAAMVFVATTVLRATMSRFRSANL